jgi:hypothetical protein
MRGASPRSERFADRIRRLFWSFWPLLSGGLIVILAMAAMPVQSGVSTSPPRQQGPEVEIDEWVLTSVRDWERGIVNGLLISNNAGGELRLEEDALQGGFLSEPIATDFAINAAGAVWRAELPEGTSLTLELRGRSDEPGEISDDTGWGPWFPLEAGDARSQADDGAFATPSVLAFPPDTNYLQLRATLRSEVARASPVLNEVTVAYLNTTEGPPTAAGLLERTPIQVGPETLTPPPDQVLRSTWSAREVTTRPDRVLPRGVVLHSVESAALLEETFPFLRALAAYQADVLGWEDLSYHYLIDDTGVLYQGRPRGPTSAVFRMAGGDTAVHIALIGDNESPPTEAALQTLTSLLAWLGEAYDIPPTEQHQVLVGDALVDRENIAAHSEVSPQVEATALADLLPEIRERVDRETIRSRWYFAEGNTQDYIQQLSLLNRSSEPTEAIIKLFPDGINEPIRRRVSVPANGRANLALNEVVTSTNNLALIVEASEPIIASQTMGIINDISIGPGAEKLSRVWYFAEGSTIGSFETFLILYNPLSTPADTTITYMRDDGSQAEQRVSVPAFQRVPINVGEVLPDARFGIRVVASQPLIAERTMRFGSGNIGLHTSSGITALSRSWLFAEGTTQPPFDMRLLLLNPNQQAAIATVTYMTPDGTEATRRYAIPRTTKLVVDVNEFVPELGVATMVESDRPLAAERALYYVPEILAEPEAETTGEEGGTVPLPGSDDPLVGTVEVGATASAFSWYFADAPTQNTNQFLLISNPSRGQARVTVDLLLADDSTSTETIVMPANSRFTLPVHNIYPDQSGVSIIVRSTQRVVAERAVYPTEGVGAGGGATTLGVPGE